MHLKPIIKTQPKKFRDIGIDHKNGNKNKKFQKPTSKSKIWDGLDILENLDHIFIKQQEFLTEKEKEKNGDAFQFFGGVVYSVQDGLRNEIFTAEENTDRLTLCSKQCWGSNGSVLISVKSSLDFTTMKRPVLPGLENKPVTKNEFPRESNKVSRNLTRNMTRNDSLDHEMFDENEDVLYRNPTYVQKSTNLHQRRMSRRFSLNNFLDDKFSLRVEGDNIYFILLESQASFFSK